MELNNIKSECAKLRPYLEKFCQGCGLELGSGGDKITPSAISVDIKSIDDPYRYPIQLIGDARFLHWFKSGTMDFVHSAHLLEDFKNTVEVMVEWTRVIRPGGHLVLNLPHEIKYREHCKKYGQSYNPNHSVLNKYQV
jgi:predicted SAM-dependent methyltransferase